MTMRSGRKSSIIDPRLASGPASSDATGGSASFTSLTTPTTWYPPPWRAAISATSWWASGLVPMINTRAPDARRRIAMDDTMTSRMRNAEVAIMKGHPEPPPPATAARVRPIVGVQHVRTCASGQSQMSVAETTVRSLQAA